MATDPTQSPLTPEQLHKLHLLSERAGKSESEVLDDLLSQAEVTLPPATNGQHPTESLHDRLSEAGILGSFSGPGDLSTNPKYMEGFGESKRSADTD